MAWRSLVIEGIREALATLRRSPLRTTLAALAMAAAVATTAVVQTALDALARSARESSARAFGTDSFVLTRVAAGTASRRELLEKLTRHPNITRGDGRFVRAATAETAIFASTATRTGDVSAASRRFENATLNGAESAVFAIRDLGLARGRALGVQDDVAAAQVVVIGAAVAAVLYPYTEPLGQPVRIAGRAFRIVGVQSVQGSAGGQSLDRQVWMPLSAFERAFGAPASIQIFGAAASGVATTSAEGAARTAMRARRHLAPGAPDTFDLITPEASRSFVTRITERIGAAAPPISLMALLAAMIVVANTTLVSVTARTREIGVRRALGARRRSILMETLAESIAIALVGGVVGLVLAAAAIAALAEPLGLPVTLDPRVALVSLAAAAASGIVAGWYPARRAGRLDVVQALRHDA